MLSLKKTGSDFAVVKGMNPKQFFAVMGAFFSLLRRERENTQRTID